MQLAAPLTKTEVSARSAVRLLPALAVLLFGIAALYAVGFSEFPRAHNAAHDTRHASGFPCH
jgi:cobalt transporter subunit CbtB